MSMKEIQKKIDMGYLYDERMKLYDHPVLRDLFLEDAMQDVNIVEALVEKKYPKMK